MAYQETLAKRRPRPQLKLKVDIELPMKQPRQKFENQNLEEFFTHWKQQLSNQDEKKYNDFSLNNCAFQIFDVCMKKCNREEQQDRYFQFIDEQKKLAFFGVFDGQRIFKFNTRVHRHGNSFISSLVSETLLTYIINNLQKFYDIPNAIEQAFKQLDEEILNYQRLQGIKGGTTVLCLLFLDNKVFLCNLGDSIAVRVREQSIEQLNTEHRLSNIEEYKQVVAKGGIVIENKKTLRIDGELSVSRALGDLNYKNSLISEPEIKIYDLENLEADYILLGTDGFWNIITQKEVCNMINSQIKLNYQPSLSQILVNQALKEAGNKRNDNITLLTINLQKLKEALLGKTEYLNVKNLQGEKCDFSQEMRKDDSTSEIIKENALVDLKAKQSCIFTFDQDL